MIDDDAGQVLPRTGPVEKALLRMQKRLTLLQEQVDALSSLENASSERLDALYDTFADLAAFVSFKGENAVNAAETTQERERHDG